MENKEIVWTEEMVIRAFEEALRTMRKLPSAKLRDYFTSWPQVIYSELKSYGWIKHQRNGDQHRKLFHAWKQPVAGFISLKKPRKEKSSGFARQELRGS